MAASHSSTFSTCEICGSSIRHSPSITRRFCSNACKGEWQRQQKPWNREWLYQKYIVEGLSADAIALIVHRDPKRVWEWLRDYGIETRPRGHTYAENPAFSFWLHGKPSPMMGRKLSVETRKRLSEIAKADGRVPFDPAVGSYMKGRKGPETTNWKGGVTPERQSFYSSKEWKEVVPLVWRRDDATCQRCRFRNSGPERRPFDIHHIISFAYAPLRAELSNLVLLCEECHYWVHGPDNIDNLFLKEIPGDPA